MNAAGKFEKQDFQLFGHCSESNQFVWYPFRLRGQTSETIYGLAMAPPKAPKTGAYTFGAFEGALEDPCINCQRMIRVLLGEQGQAASTPKPKAKVPTDDALLDDYYEQLEGGDEEAGEEEADEDDDAEDADEDDGEAGEDDEAGEEEGDGNAEEDDAGSEVAEEDNTAADEDEDADDAAGGDGEDEEADEDDGEEESGEDAEGGEEGGGDEGGDEEEEAEEEDPAPIATNAPTA
ncbi:putative Midasin [Glarea lozoyensis 74030]|uniref:Putative Midasin n=1 Tax=Glarea lozoyensis (strain ATCC 74030 / MF5533) TaxID=1104152 RepID=H0EES5_GLAL7|nr:putative Midasin [Glarea lozoyensis 74030]